MAFEIPGAAEIDALHGDADKIIDATTTLLDALEQHKTILTLIGLGAELPAIEKIDAGLKTAKALLDKVPSL